MKGFLKDSKPFMKLKELACQEVRDFVCLSEKKLEAEMPFTLKQFYCLKFYPEFASFISQSVIQLIRCFYPLTFHSIEQVSK